jgi:hypothetical protein
MGKGRRQTKKDIKGVAAHKAAMSALTPMVYQEDSDGYPTGKKVPVAPSTSGNVKAADDKNVRSFDKVDQRGYAIYHSQHGARYARGEMSGAELQARDESNRDQKITGIVEDRATNPARVVDPRI